MPRKRPFIFDSGQSCSIQMMAILLVGMAACFINMILPLLSIGIFATLYAPEPVLILPKTVDGTISTTPVFVAKPNLLGSLVPYPFSYTGVSRLEDAETGEYISCVGGNGGEVTYFHRVLIPEKPLRDGQRVKLTVTVVKHLGYKYSIIYRRNFYYYFTADSAQKPSPEEQEVMDELEEIFGQFFPSGFPPVLPP